MKKQPTIFALGAIAAATVVLLLILSSREILVQYHIFRLRGDPERAAELLHEFVLHKSEFPERDALDRLLQKSHGHRLLLQTTVRRLFDQANETGGFRFNWPADCEACAIWPEAKYWIAMESSRGSGGRVDFRDQVLSALLSKLSDLPLLDVEEVTLPERPDLAFRILPGDVGFMVTGFRPWETLPRADQLVCVGRKVSAGAAGRQLIGAEAIPLLLDGARSDKPELRKLALETLQRIGADPEDPVPYLISLLRKPVFSMPSEAGLEAVIKCLKDRGAQAVKPLIEHLEHGGHMREIATIMVLGEIAASENMDVAVQREATQALESVDSEAVNRLITLLKIRRSGDKKRGTEIIRLSKTLGAIGPRSNEAIPELRRIAEDRDAGEEARRAAQEAIRKMDGTIFEANE